MVLGVKSLAFRQPGVNGHQEGRAEYTQDEGVWVEPFLGAPTVKSKMPPFRCLTLLAHFLRDQRFLGPEGTTDFICRVIYVDKPNPSNF